MQTTLRAAARAIETGQHFKRTSREEGLGSWIKIVVDKSNYYSQQKPYPSDFQYNSFFAGLEATFRRNRCNDNDGVESDEKYIKAQSGYQSVFRPFLCFSS